MFQRSGKKNVKDVKSLFHIFSPEKLLKNEKHRDIINEIRGISALDADRFDSLCLTLIYSITEYCQTLPDATFNYYAQPYGLIDRALQRTHMALILLQDFLILPESNQLSEEQKLWQYVLFSAAMLQGLGKLKTDYKIELYNARGSLLKQWNPLIEALYKAENSHYYFYTLLKEPEPTARFPFNILLASHLIPKEGFNWIASNDAAFTTWLSLLHEDTYHCGTLKAILGRSDALAIQKFLYLLKQKQFNLSNLDSTDKTIYSEQELGLDFLEWMRNSLERGTLAINKAPLMLTEEGLLLSSEIFQLYVAENPHIQNWEAVREAFLRLNVHQLSLHSLPHNRLEFSVSKQTYMSILFTKFGIIIPNTLFFQETEKKKPSSLSALEFMNKAGNTVSSLQRNNKSATLQILNEKGKWQKKEGGHIPAFSLNIGHHR